MAGLVWKGTYLKEVSTNRIGVVSAICGPQHDRFAVKLLLSFADALPFSQVNRTALDTRSLRDIPELVVSSETSEFASDDVTLAFVFHYEQLDEQLAYIQGMQNVYLVRFDRNGEDVPHSDFFSFPSLQTTFQGVCLASSVWRSLVAIQEETHRLMGRVSERQGLFCEARGTVQGLPLPSWRYIQRIASGKEFVTTSRSQSKRIFLSDLEVASKRVKKACTLMRFKSHSDIYCLIRLLGDTAIADVRKRRPKLGTSHDLEQNDAINTIVGAPDNQPPALFERKTKSDGVDFEYIEEDAMLHLTVRYRKYLVRRNSNGILVNCPSAYLARLINMECVYREVENRGADADGDGGDDDDAAVVGDHQIFVAGAEFSYDDSLYRVVEHRLIEGKVYATCVYPKNQNPLFGVIRTVSDLSEIRRRILLYVYGA